MTHDWGRFTARGGTGIEEAIRGAVEDVSAVLEKTLRPEEYRAVVLLGGYGRGEGGVESINGRERPHNNLDLLAITCTDQPDQAIKRRIDEALEPLERRYEIGIDVGCIGERKLRRAPCLVMWYDMRHGHKTLLGDANFVPGLQGFTRERILPADVNHLVVNRGTLIVVNDLLLDRSGSLDEAARRVVVKHGIKAVVGYGDALLFFLGQYDWSYLKKQERMRECSSVAASFRELYESASEFRFRPRYDAYLDRDLAAWNDELRAALEPIHLECESRRLGMGGLDWSRYPAGVSMRVLTEDIGSPRAWGRRLRHLLAGGTTGGGGLLERLGRRCAGEKGRLAIAFPVVVYGSGEPFFRRLAGDLLGASGTEAAELRRAYLRVWSEHGDPNFGALLRRLGIDLEG